MVQQIQKQFDKAGRACRTLIFFALFYLYFWLEIEPKFIFLNAGQITDLPVFYMGWDFFRPYLLYPGGITEYFAGFIVQFFYYSWTGALILTMTAWLLCLCTDKILKALNAPTLTFLRFVPPIMIMMIYSQYMHFIVPIVAIMITLIFVNIHIKFARNTNQVGPVLLVESLILYYICGGAFLLFALLCAIYEFLYKQRWRAGCLCLVFGLVIPYVIGVAIFNVSIIDAFSNSLPVSWRIQTLKYRHRYGSLNMIEALYVLYIFLPIAAILISIWQLFSNNLILSFSKKNTKEQPRQSALKRISSRYKNSPVTKGLVGSFVLLIITVLAAYSFKDDRRKAFFETDYYLYHKNWPKVLSAARRYPNDPSLVHAADQALYYSGRLGYDLFKVHLNRQNINALLLTDDQFEKCFWNKGNISIETGMINRAVHQFTCALEFNGRQPAVLKKLAYSYMIKGNLDSARIFLNVLSKSIFHSCWAKDYLDRIDSDPTLSKDKEIQRLRSLIVQEDIAFKASSSFYKTLRDDVTKDRKNQMVFEYLLTLSLLDKQLDQFVQTFSHFNEYDYPEIPTIFEEAVLLYEHTTEDKIDLKGRSVSESTQKRFDEFLKAREKYPGNEKADMDKLRKNFSESYFLYFTYKKRR